MCRCRLCSRSTCLCWVLGLPSEVNKISMRRRVTQTQRSAYLNMNRVESNKINTTVVFHARNYLRRSIPLCPRYNIAEWRKSLYGSVISAVAHAQPSWGSARHCTRGHATIQVLPYDCVLLWFCLLPQDEMSLSVVAVRCGYRIRTWSKKYERLLSYTMLTYLSWRKVRACQVLFISPHREEFPPHIGDVGRRCTWGVGSRTVLGTDLRTSWQAQQ